MSLSEAPSGESRGTWVNVIKDSLTIFGGFASILVVATWYLGRRSLVGYFDAMNIPKAQLSLSATDYFEQGWSNTTLFIFIPSVFIGVATVVSLKSIKTKHFYINTILLTLSLISIASLIFSLALLLISTYYPISPFFTVVILVLLATMVVLLYRMDIILDTFGMTFTALYLVLGSVLVIWSWLLTIGWMAYTDGAREARADIINSSMQIRLIAAEPLMLDAPRVTSTTVANNTTYTYEGLRLLTYNNERYFLFSSVDAECKPEQVYIVKDEKLQSVHYITAPPLKPDCIPTSNGRAQPSSKSLTSPAPPTTPVETP